MKAVFIGAEGSMGLECGKIYRINARLGLFKLRQSIIVDVCPQAPWDSGFEVPYDSMLSFLHNWKPLIDPKCELGEEDDWPTD